MFVSVLKLRQEKLAAPASCRAAFSEPGEPRGVGGALPAGPAGPTAAPERSRTDAGRARRSPGTPPPGRRPAAGSATRGQEDENRRPRDTDRLDQNWCFRFADSPQLHSLRVNHSTHPVAFLSLFLKRESPRPPGPCEGGGRPAARETDWTRAAAGGPRAPALPSQRRRGCAFVPFFFIALMDFCGWVF